MRVNDCDAVPASSLGGSNCGAGSFCPLRFFQWCINGDGGRVEKERRAIFAPNVRAPLKQCALDYSFSQSNLYSIKIFSSDLYLTRTSLLATCDWLRAAKVIEARLGMSLGKKQMRRGNYITLQNDDFSLRCKSKSCKLCAGDFQNWKMNKIDPLRAMVFIGVCCLIAILISTTQNPTARRRKQWVYETTSPGLVPSIISADPTGHSGTSRRRSTDDCGPTGRHHLVAAAKPDNNVPIGGRHSSLPVARQPWRNDSLVPTRLALESERTLRH